LIGMSSIVARVQTGLRTHINIAVRCFGIGWTYFHHGKSLFIVLGIALLSFFPVTL
jgi:hypothetical protein